MPDLVHLVQPRPDLVPDAPYSYLVHLVHLVYIETRYEVGRERSNKAMNSITSSSSKEPAR